MTGKQNLCSFKKLKIKPRAMPRLVQSAVAQGIYGFTMLKAQLNQIAFSALSQADFKKAILILQGRIEEFLKGEGCFCYAKDNSTFILFLNRKLTNTELLELGWDFTIAICQPLSLGNKSILPEVNAALAIYPHNGKNYGALEDSLNIALDVAKKIGVDAYSVYNPKLSIEQSKENKQLAELKGGINKNQFFLYYQPIVDLIDMRVCGAEALLRWQHPIKGIVAPKDFFDAIESTGEIYQLGLWTFEQMLSQWEIWKKEMVASVCTLNLSLKQLIHPTLADDIKAIIKKFPNTIVNEIYFEISGFAACSLHEILQNNLRSLHNMGFELAIDNFDLSSLNATLSLPIKIVKVSNKCLAQTSKEQMLELLRVGKERGISFVAEGIESQKMQTYAENLGITKAQGFYFAMPTAAQDFLKEVKKLNERYVINIEDSSLS